MDRHVLIDRPALLGLIEPDRWQRLQDQFATVLGIPLRTVTATHELLSAPSWPPAFEYEPAMQLLRIGEELPQLFPSSQGPPAVTSATTPLGITYATVPIRATSTQIVAYVVLGPCIVGARDSEPQLRDRASQLQLDADVLWPMLLSLKLHTHSSIRSALQLIEEVGTSIVGLAYQVKRLAGASA